MIKSSVTAMLNVWKRPHLKEQLEAIFSQSLMPSEVWILHLENHVSLGSELRRFRSIRYIQSNMNLKYFGRFSVSLMAPSEFVWLLDDDVIPSKYWLEYSLDCCKRHAAIVAGAGRIIPKGCLYPELIVDSDHLKTYFVGDRDVHLPHNFSEKDTMVDFGCNSWVLQKKWLHYFWSVSPYTMNTAEDIHLSASCSTSGKIPTIVPKQDSLSNCGNLKKSYGNDSNASWRLNNFLNERSEVIKYWTTERNWTPLLW